MNALEPSLRPAFLDDATTIAALAIQVFLDTYATEGVRPDLAREALVECSVEAFAHRLQEPNWRFVLAEQHSGLIGFAEIHVSSVHAPVGNVEGAELVRLYVQPRFHSRGIGRRLLHEAAEIAATGSLEYLWLNAWEGNHRARSFYAANGYQDVGATTYCFEDICYTNRVLVKQIRHSSSAC